MPTRRPGQATGFWDNVTVPAGGFSHVARTGWGYDNFCIFLTVGGATTITLYASPIEPASMEGIFPDEPNYEANTAEFFPCFYLDTELKWTFTGASTKAVLIPDFTPLYCRLKSSGTNIVITAGWLASGD